MSVEFRPRKISEYLRSARRRKWLILLPTIAIGLAIAYVVFRLPDVYESSTLIVVKPSTLPNSVVPTISEETLTRELTSISQVVTSRSSLQPLMEKYDLFKEERLRGEPTELLIDQMRKQIKVEVNTSRNDITNGFNITYRGRDPKSTQAVAAELASKYIDEQTKGTINAGTSAIGCSHRQRGAVTCDIAVCPDLVSRADHVVAQGLLCAGAGLRLPAVLLGPRVGALVGAVEPRLLARRIAFGVVVLQVLLDQFLFQGNVIRELVQVGAQPVGEQ